MIGANEQAVIDSIRGLAKIRSAVKRNGVVIVTLKSQFDLARIPGNLQMKRTGRDQWPVMVYKWHEGVQFRCLIRAVPDRLKNRSVEVV